MSYEQFRTSIREPALIAMAEHWNAARSDRMMPAWHDIDPAAIKEHLPIVWAWRWDAARGTFVGRLAGEDNIAIIGANIRGKTIEECFPPGSFELLKERFKRVVDSPALMSSTGRVRLIGGREGYGDRIVLPVAEDGRRADGIIGATVYRLGPRPATGEAIVDHRDEDTRFFALAPTPLP